MQYIKHYYIDDVNNIFCCDAINSKYRRHPWKEYSGLEVKVWLTDSDNIDICLSLLPDSTPVSTIVSSSGKNAVQVLTEEQYNSVAVPYFEVQNLYDEVRKAKESGDDLTAEEKESLASVKLSQSVDAIRAL